MKWRADNEKCLLLKMPIALPNHVIVTLKILFLSTDVHLFQAHAGLEVFLTPTNTFVSGESEFYIYIYIEDNTQEEPHFITFFHSIPFLIIMYNDVTV